jgi:hypothetical protein
MKQCTKCKRGHRLCVDHNHKTGKVRGLLCDSCNQWLGAIENKQFLEKALVYLATKDV